MAQPATSPALQNSVAAVLAVMLKPADRLLVAVSGGPDSVALLHALRSLPYQLTVGHVDHQLRRGSAGDARFVAALAARWDLPCHIRQIEVRQWAHQHGSSLEEAARDRRYHVLSQMAQASRCQVLVTAHTASDQAETVLLNFLRGGGPAGLAGMPVARSMGRLRLIRPLLNVRRDQVESYLKEHRLASRRDPTNKDPYFTRNRLRLETLPQLSRQFPGLSSRLTGLADIFRVEEDYWAPVVTSESMKTARQDGKKIIIDLKRLIGYHKALARRILRQLLPGLTFQDCERIFSLVQMSSGNKKGLHLSGGRRVVVRPGKMIIQH